MMHSLKRIRQIIAIIIAVLCIAGLATAAAEKGNTQYQSFNKAKKILLDQVYYDHLTTFYCNCPFTMDKKIIPSDKYTPKERIKTCK